MMRLWVVVFCWMSKLGILTMVAFGSEASGNLLQARKRVKQPNQRGRLHHRSFLSFLTYTHPHNIYIYLFIYIHTPVIPPVIPSLKSWVLSHGTINPSHTCSALRPAPCFFTWVFWSWLWQRADSLGADGSGCPLVLWSRKGG